LGAPLWGASLGSESTVGLAAEYNSNPFLQAEHPPSTESAAFLANIPLTYTFDAQTFDLTPRIRQAESRGASQLLTNYEYLDADWQWKTERSSVSAAADWHRDSTFYDVVENASLHGRTLPRLDETANAGWQYALSERSNLRLGGSYERVGFGRSAGASLADYDYAQGSAQFARNLTERTSWSSSVGVGRYTLRDQPSRNIDRFVQTSLSHDFSELWSGSAQVGYSRVGSESQAILCCEIVPLNGHLALEYVSVHESTAEGISSYALNVQRRSELGTVALAASRMVQPSALGALLTENDITLNASRALSERLTLSGSLRRTQQSDAFQGTGNLANAYFYVGSLGLQWRWTEHWDVALGAIYDNERVSTQTASAKATSVSLTLTRQLGRVRLD
jgi:hypothetical protein